MIFVAILCLLFFSKNAFYLPEHTLAVVHNLISKSSICWLDIANKLLWWLRIPSIHMLHPVPEYNVRNCDLHSEIRTCTGWLPRRDPPPCTAVCTISQGCSFCRNQSYLNKRRVLDLLHWYFQCAYGTLWWWSKLRSFMIVVEVLFLQCY